MHKLVNICPYESYELLMLMVAYEALPYQGKNKQKGGNASLKWDQ